MRPPAGGVARRALALALPCVLVVASLAGWAWSRRDELREPFESGPFGQTDILGRLDLWERHDDARSTRGIVLFGDSLMICGPVLHVGGLVKDRLTREGRAVALLALLQPALRPLNYYYFVEDVVATAPAVAVVEVNLRLFGQVGATGAERFAQLSRRLPLRRALRVREALVADELSLLDPLVYRGEDVVGALFVADGVRVMGADGLEALGGAVERALGVRRVPVYRHYAATLTAAARARVVAYAADFADHPDAQVLHELRAALRGAGVATIFYVSPIDPRPLEGRKDIARTLPDRLEALRRRIGAASEEWLDLHALLPPPGFSDHSNHLTPAGCGAVADRIVPAARSHLR